MIFRRVNIFIGRNFSVCENLYEESFFIMKTFERRGNWDNWFDDHFIEVYWRGHPSSGRDN